MVKYHQEKYKQELCVRVPRLACNLLILTLSQTSPGFYVSAVQIVWKHCGKGEIARNDQFLLFPQCFLPVWRTFCHFHQIWNCCLQTLSVWKSLKLVVWERVTHWANGRVMDKKSFYPFISVLCTFLIRWIRSLSGDVRWCPFRPVLSFEHVQNFPPDKTDRDARLMYGYYVA